MNKLTIAAAKKQINEMGFSFRKTDSGDFRVNIYNGTEDTAYYTNDLQDAIDTAKHMATMNVGTAKTDCDLTPAVVAALQQDNKQIKLNAILEGCSGKGSPLTETEREMVTAILTRLSYRLRNSHSNPEDGWLLETVRQIHSVSNYVNDQPTRH